MADQFDYFDESDNWSGVTPEGLFPAHVMECDKELNHSSMNFRDKSKKHICDYYQFVFKLAEETANREYKDGDGNVITGISLVDRTVKSKRFYKFKTPTKTQLGDGYVGNPGGNGQYMKVIESFGVELEEKVIKKGNVDVTVKVLPDLNPTELLGEPVMVEVYHRKWKDKEGNAIIIESTGKQGISAEVRSVTNWKEGKVDEEAKIPF